MKTIVITAGHRNVDPGAVANGLKEAVLAVELRDIIALKLREKGCEGTTGKTGTERGKSVSRRREEGKAGPARRAPGPGKKGNQQRARGRGGRGVQLFSAGRTGGQGDIGLRTLLRWRRKGLGAKFGTDD